MQQVLFRSWLLVLLISGAAPSLWADAGLDFFEAKIRPVLVEHCYSCHAAEGKSVKGGLFLDSRAGMQQGGESGPAVVPHRVDESLIVEALRYESFEMPPKQRLPEEIVNNFVKWIEMGAPDPRDGEVPKSPEVAFDLSAAREFWAFQPPVRPPVPRVQSMRRSPGGRSVRSISLWSTNCTRRDWGLHHRPTAAR